MDPLEDPLDDSGHAGWMARIYLTQPLRDAGCPMASLAAQAVFHVIVQRQFIQWRVAQACLMGTGLQRK